jgi:hypothetical protein
MRESEAVSAVARVDCVLGIEIENGNHDGCPCVPGNLGAGRPEGRWQAISSLRAASCRFVPLRAASCRFVPLRAASCPSWFTRGHRFISDHHEETKEHEGEAGWMGMESTMIPGSPGGLPSGWFPRNFPTGTKLV